MALQAQTSDDPDNLPFTAADCDDLDLSAAIRRFVFEPLAQELGEAVGDGWVWLIALTKIDAIADPAERAEAREAFNRVKRQLPDYTEAEYIALYADPHGDVLALQQKSAGSPALSPVEACDLIWPTQLEVEDILPALHSLAELSKRPIDKNAIRSVARRIATRWHDLIEFLRRGELVAMGIHNHRERVSPKFWSEQKTCINVLRGSVITEGTEWTDLRLYVMASRAVRPAAAVPTDVPGEVRQSPAHAYRVESRIAWGSAGQPSHSLTAGMLSPARPDLAAAAVAMISDRDIDDPDPRATIAAAIESSPGHFGSCARPRRTRDTLRHSRSKMIAVVPQASMAPTVPETEQSARENHSGSKDHPDNKHNQPKRRRAPTNQKKWQIAHLERAVNALGPKLYDFVGKKRAKLINNWFEKEGALPPLNKDKKVFVSDRTIRRYFEDLPS